MCVKKTGEYPHDIFSRSVNGEDSSVGARRDDDSSGTEQCLQIPVIEAVECGFQEPAFRQNEFGKEIVYSARVSDIAFPTTGDQDFLPQTAVPFEQNHRTSFVGRVPCSDDACTSAADYYNLFLISAHTYKVRN
jgi:hypothetical protein